MTTFTGFLHGLGFVLAGTFFSLMSWVSLKFFTVDDPGSRRGKRLISVLAGGTAVLVLWVLGTMATPPSLAGASVLAAANALYLYACGMLYWAWRANQATPLDFIGSLRPPSHLNREGPYAIVRHPFYSAYCASWIGSMLATQGHPAVTAMGLVLILVYVFGAHGEEQLFAMGTYGPTYLIYSKDVPMLIPRLTGCRPRD